MVASIVSPGLGMAADTRQKLKALLERTLKECPRMPAGLRQDIEAALQAKPGGKPKLDPAVVKQLMEAPDADAQLLAVKLGVSQATLYRTYAKAKRQ